MAPKAKGNPEKKRPLGAIILGIPSPWGRYPTLNLQCILQVERNYLINEKSAPNLSYWFTLGLGLPTSPTLTPLFGFCFLHSAPHPTPPPPNPLDHSILSSPYLHTQWPLGQSCNCQNGAKGQPSSVAGRSVTFCPAGSPILLSRL